MLYLFALVGVVTIAVVLWRVFTADPARVPDRSDPQPPAPGTGTGPQSPRGTAIGPDDDPEFLRSIDPDKPDD